MKPGPKAVLDEPRTKRKAVALLARGATKADVARKVGCARSTVSMWTNQEEAKRWIEDETHKYLESLPDALAISKNLLRAGRTESGKLVADKHSPVDHKVLEMAIREGESMRKSIGITPAHSQSIVVANIYNDNRQHIIDPRVMGLLQDHLRDMVDITDNDRGNGDDEDRD